MTKVEESGYESLYGDELGRIEIRNHWNMKEVASLFSETFQTDPYLTNTARVEWGLFTGVEAPAYEVHYSELEPIDFTVPTRVMTFDIETDDRGEFPDLGEKRILSIVAHDSYTNEMVAFIDLAGRSVAEAFPKGKPEGIDAVHYDKDERRMLIRFACWVQETSPDVVTGWNIEDFDIPYLLARMDVLDVNADRMSREDYARVSDRGHARMKGHSIHDMLIAYKSTKRGELRSFSLDAVAEVELGEQKLDHTGESIYEMWTDDVDKLLRYNAKDVRLVVEIDREAGVLDFKQALRHEIGVDLEGTTANHEFIDMMARRKLHEKGLIAPDAKYVEKEEKYEGAYVFPPYTGVAENVIGMDLSSLYPMTMAMLNASPEVVLPSGADDDGWYDSKGTLIPGIVAKAPNGARFRLEEDGILKELVDDAIDLKADYKEMRDSFEAGTTEYEEASEKYDVNKTKTNSVYGVAGWERFFLYDERVAEAVTTMGQTVIKATQEYIDEHTVGEVVYGDTDSNYVKFPSEWSKERCLEEAFKITEELNNEVYPELAEQHGVPAEDNRWNIEVESYMERYFQAGKKKRYAYLCTWKDGQDCKPKVSIAGFTRSDISMLTKDLQDEILDMILHGATEIEIGQKIHAAAQEIAPSGADLDRIGIPGGISKPLEEYAWTRGSPQGAHPRAAWYSNCLLGTNFGSGSKPKRIYVKPFAEDGFDEKIDVLAFEEAASVPQSVRLDTSRMTQALIVNPLGKILDAIDVDVDAAIKNQLQTGLSKFV